MVPQLRQEPQHEQTEQREHGDDDDRDARVRAERVQHAGDDDDAEQQPDQQPMGPAAGGCLSFGHSDHVVSLIDESEPSSTRPRA